MNTVMKNLIKYLLESEKDTVWDNNMHAVTNLVTVFGCSKEEAVNAVLTANPTTKDV